MSYDFLERKKFFPTPQKPPGGYFKDFRLIFTILGFKELKMGQKRKFLSQISYIWMKYDIKIQKKISSDPPDAPWGSSTGEFTWKFDVFYCLLP